MENFIHAKLIYKVLDCIGANGSGRRTVVELSNGDYPYGIAITENSIIWTDWRR